MTTATATKDAETKHVHADAGAILFELEGIACGGRQAAFDALRKALAAEDVKFSPAQFARFCLFPSPDFYAADLPEKIGAKKVNGAKLAADVKAALDAFYASDKVEVNAGLVKVIDAGQKMGLETAAISSLSEEAGQSLLARLGLADKGVRLFSFSAIESHFPRADVWLKVCRQMGKSPRACVVVSDHSAACKAALAASVKCVAVPNAYTAHQDYCGADVTLESWDEMSAREILEAVAPAK